MSGGSWGGWPNQSTGWTFPYTTVISASGTNGLCGLAQQQPFQPPSVMASPSLPLSDREWLDAQVGEVCELANAA